MNERYIRDVLENDIAAATEDLAIVNRIVRNRE